MKKYLFLLMFFCMIANDASAKTRTMYRNALILAFSLVNSVYEDDSIKLEFYNQKLWATNKTSKTIFIDLSQCFAIRNESAVPFISTGEEDKLSDKDNKKTSKKGISSKDDIFIAIAPTIGIEQKETFICDMSSYVYGDYSTTEQRSKDFTEFDKRFLRTLDELVDKSTVYVNNDARYEGTVALHLTEDESILSIGASIAYSFNKKTENWTTVTLSTWVSDVIFSPYYIELPKELKKKEKRGFGIKETDPMIIHVKANSPFEYDDDKSPIIICDWKGNYKKGTFSLKQIWVDAAKKQTTAKNSVLRHNTEEYKSIVHFDKADADWGILKYVDSQNETGQSKK